MANSGFSALAQVYAATAAQIGELAPQFLADVPTEAEFQGRLADSARERMASIAAHMNAVSEFAQSRVGVFNMQFDGDAKLAVAPTEADVQAAKDAWRQAREAGLPAALQRPLYDEAGRISEERRKALDKHEGTCSVSEGQIAASSVPVLPVLPADPTVDGGGAPGGSDDPGKSKHGEGGVEDDPQPGESADDGGGGDTFTPALPADTAAPSSMVTDTAANTSLTSDTGLMSNGAGAMPPQQMMGQPSVQAQPAGGAGGGTPQPAPASTGIPTGSMLSTPRGDRNGGTSRNKSRDRDSGITPGSLDGLLGVGLPAAAAAAVGSTVDRGSSVSGVTTERNIAGPGATQGTALSGANGANPNNPNANSQAGMRGGMGMGGMPMGAGAGLGGGGGTVKTPDIKSTTPEPLAEQQQREAVEGGTLGRASAADPTTKDEEKR